MLGIYTLIWVINVNLDVGFSVLFRKEQECEEVAHVLSDPMLMACVYSREDMDCFVAGSEGDVTLSWLSLNVVVFEGGQAYSVARVEPSELGSDFLFDAGGVVSPKLLLLLICVLSEVKL